MRQLGGPSRSTAHKGHWDKKEHLKYFLYVYHHQRQIEDEGVRRSLQLFKGMSFFIQSRSPAQCRTHHKKVLLKNGCLSNAIETYVSKRRYFMDIYQFMR